MKKSILFILMAILCMAIKAQTYYATVTPSTVEAGGTGEFWVNLVNKDIDFTAFQMDVTLPEGFCFSYTVGREGELMYDDPELSKVRTDGTKPIFDSNRVSADGRTMNVIVHSNLIKNFYNTTWPDGKTAYEMIKFKYVAEEDVQPGLYEGSVTYIAISTTDKVSYECPDVKFTILVKGDGSVVTLNVTSAGVATLMLPFSAALPTGLNAWRCDEVAGDEISATQMGNIPANTPLLITGAAGTYTFNGTPTNDKEQYTAGILTGTFELLNLTSGYVLQNHGGTTAFYSIEAVDGENILPYRCYIPSEKVAAGVRMLRLADTPTGIGTSTIDGTEDAYDLSGRKADAHNGHGIRIINNTKILKR